MKKYFIPFSLLIFSVLTSQINAQVFQKNYGISNTHCFAESVQQTSDGGFIFQGWCLSPYQKMELIKTNNQGVVIWKKEYIKCENFFNGTCIMGYGPIMGGCVQQTSDGGYIVCGNVDDKMLLIKTTNTGALTWSKTYGAASYGKYVRQTIDGGYICVGYSGANAYIIKTSSNGVLEWDRVFHISSNYNDAATDVDQLTNGQIVVTGYSFQIYGNDTTSDVFVLRLDQAGGILSANTYGQNNQNEEGQSISKTTDGGYIVAGFTSQTTHPLSATDVFLWKFDGGDSPSFQYSYKVGGFVSMALNFGYAAQETSDGGYALFGVTLPYGSPNISYFNNFLLKLNNIGNPVFCKTYKDTISGGTPISIANTIWNDGKQLANGGYIIGSSCFLSSNSNLGFKLIKTNSIGESGCNESLINPIKYNFAPAAEAKTLTNLATSITADAIINVSDPTVVEEPTCSATCEARPGNDITICHGNGSFQLGEIPAAVNGTAPYIYTWSPATGLSASNIPNPVYTPTTSVAYTLTIQDSEGCTSSESITITINICSTVTTNTTSSITSNSATSGGNVTSDGGFPVTSRGVCWSTSANPTISNNFTSDAVGTGTFTSNITGLDQNTIYHVRAYATNSNGTAYGNDVSFKTSIPNSTEVFLTNIAFVSLQQEPSLPNIPLVMAMSYENPENFVNPGKKIRFKMECFNNKSNGLSIVSGLCKVRTADPSLVLSDSTSGLNNVAWNQSAWSTDEFEVSIPNNAAWGHVYNVDFVVVENGIEYFTYNVPIPIAPLDLQIKTIDDDNNPDSQGNGNGLCESGEIIESFPTLYNVSTMAAATNRGIFENYFNYAGINVWNNHPGISGNVVNECYWNYSFGQPQVINPGDIDMGPEFDFVFDYNYTETYYFKLALKMSGTFQVFANKEAFMRWLIPIDYNIGYPEGALAIDENLVKNNLKAYPNPITNELIIEIEGNTETVNFEIFNAIGQVVFKGSLLTKTVVNTNSFATGVYLIKLANGKTLEFKKIVKE